MKISRWLLVAVLLLAAASAFAQTKPNFTGEWNLNAAKSDFGGMPAPSSAVQKITHNEPDLKVVNTQTGEMGTMTLESSYTTDGKECVNNGPMGGQVKSKLRWDGSALVIDSAMDIQGNAITVTNRMTLSEDGKNLTVAAHFASPMGEGDAKMVFDKK